MDKIAEANNKYWGSDPISEERYDNVIPRGDTRRNDYEAGFRKATNMGAIGTPRHFYALGYAHCAEDKAAAATWNWLIVACAIVLGMLLEIMRRTP